MTNDTVPPPTQPTTPVTPPAEGSRSLRGAAITAGVGILVMAALAPFGVFFAVDGLVTQGDAAQTAADITASEGLFRAGIASLFLVIALDVVIACALYRVFSPVNKGVSLLAMAFRLVYSGIYLVAVGHLLAVLRLLDGDAGPSVFSPDQVHAQVLSEINAFNDVWALALGLFGLHLLTAGYLAFRSGYAPRVLGVLLAIAGLGYVIDTFGAIAVQDSWTDVSSFTFLGELLLALWLVIRGRRVSVRSARGLLAEDE
ncbi:DUF4386 domain-containing protein [Kribbella sp. VKM Ac-2568]|uniref:DUF4386 domain-containing protein n=1 Tax=Kribbella sp. VKM Ac-2568 TaxID=2512219 RepID=UPI0010494895|nr:DUF4386 domain-containing protein [Kribbella sp. VKM Ac-2568]TCM40371.1 uncharacterized protein DUF4386 [Kribbella sp. VKM Ac-2568]